jgi:hypothetical protein
LKDQASEQFHDSLIRQYQDLIQEAIVESVSDHRTRLNLGVLNSKLQLILRAAHYDGISETIINRLIEDAMPTHIEKAA